MEAIGREQVIYMEKLRAAGLIGGGLVPLAGALAKRYNKCLELMGISPSALGSFEVDAMGWSPQIAEEKGDQYYLNSGDANVNAIIISPDQQDKPAHMPTHSFDRDLMNAVFVAYGKEIRDITKDSGLCLNFNQKIDSFYESFDLLRYDTVTVSFKLLDALDVKKLEQLFLIKKLIQETPLWIVTCIRK